MSEILFRSKNVMTAELNVRICIDCGKTFRTPSFANLCPSCKEKHKKASQKKTQEITRAVKLPKEKERPKPKVSLMEEQRIERIYNSIHKDRYYGYSEIVNIIESRQGNHCVCCGVFRSRG